MVETSGNTRHSEKHIGFFEQLRELVNTYRVYDPATKSKAEILFLYPGIRAWIFHKASRYFLLREIPFFPRLLTEVGRLLSGIDIHPGARLGRRVIMDHGSGIVIGETAVVGDDVIIYQGVTLGGTSLERSKRHPTIEARCVLGAGAKILGNIRIGMGSRVGANSVVISNVPQDSTVVGIPARIVKGGVKEGEELEHQRLLDPLLERLEELEKKVKHLCP